MRTTLLLLLGCWFFIGIVQAQNQSGPAKFEIDMITPGKKNLYVDRTWKPTTDCIEVRFSASVATAYKDIKLKAYFFGANDKLVETVGEPTSEGNYKAGIVKQPETIEAGKKYTVYFGIPRAIDSPGSKWKRVVVVIGKAGDYAVKIHPTDDIAKFAFPEKSQANPAK